LAYKNKKISLRPLIKKRNGKGDFAQGNSKAMMPEKVQKNE